MARADDIGAALKAEFPGLRVTSTVRTRAEQDALIASGATKARNSQHLTGNGIDIVLPKGVSTGDVRSWLSNRGIEPGEFLNESGNGSNQGTGTHLHIGLAPRGAAKRGDPASTGGGSSFDRAKASRDRVQGPSIDNVYRAYQNVGKAGGMTPQEAAQFERAVLDGHVMLPRGASIKAKPPVAVLPPKVIQAYNSHAMDDDPHARAQIEKAVAAGEVSLPRGMSLQKPAPRSAGERIGMGVRDIASGAGGLVDVFAAPANILINDITGANLDTHPGANLAGYVSDKMGLAKPESDTENLISAVNQGGSQGLMTAGIGVAASPIEGATGIIGKTLASNPILDTVSGATSGGASEYARQSGAGPVGQIAAGLIGGAAPVGLAATAERIRAPRALPDVVAETPRAAVVDEAGNLTPHGQEIATRHNATPEQVVAAYEAPPSVRTATANDQMPEVAAKEATNNTPVEEPVAAPRRAEESPELPPQSNVSGGSQNTPDVPAMRTPQALDAAQRVATAGEFGVDMTRGQATKSFDVQDAESRLKNSNGPEGEAMRQFSAQQVQQVNQAVADFKTGFGEDLPADQRGAVVQEAVRELRDLGQAGVSALYKQARELGEPLDLAMDGIKQAYERVMVEANVPDAAKAEITQEAARYGLIGKYESTNEAGISTVKLDDGQTVKFYGKPEPLRLDNAEEFRKVISDLYQSDGKRKITQTIKRAIDDAVEEAAVKVADGKGGNMSEAMRNARDAHIAQKKTFEAKDIVQAIADWKKGMDDVTGALKPEQVMARALASTSDLKRIKAVLLASKTTKSIAAWRAIQAHGVAKIFEMATQRNANVGGEITDAISGAKLRTAIQAFDVDKLKVLLDPQDFSTLMKLRRVIEDVTIPITGTVNPSGSGNLIMRLMKDVDNQFTAAASAAGFAIGGPAGAAIGGGAARMVSPVIKSAKDSAAAVETLKNATEYTANRAVNDTGAPKASAVREAGSKVKQASAKTIAAFIETYSSPRVLAPILVATQGAKE